MNFSKLRNEKHHLRENVQIGTSNRNICILRGDYLNIERIERMPIVKESGLIRN